MKILSEIKKSDSSSIFISNLFIAILNFSTTIFLIRILGQEEFGKYVIISSFILLLQVVFGLRTGEAVLKFIKKESDERDKNKTINQLLTIDFIINCVLYFMIAIIGYFYATNQSMDYNYILVFGCIVFVNTGFNIFENLYIINNEIVKMHKIKLVATSLIFMLTLTFGFIWQLKGAILGVVLGSLFKNILHYYFVKNKISINKVVINKYIFSGLKKYLVFFKNTYISTTFKAGSQGLDIFLLSLVFGSDKIALYEAGKKFSQIPGLFIGSIWTAKSNLIVEYSQSGNETKLFKMIKKTYKTFIPLGILLSFLFFITGKDLLVLLFGNSFAEAFPIALIFFVFYWFGILFGGFGRLYLISINKPNILAFLNGLIFFNVLVFGYFTSHNLVHMALTICLTVIFNGLYLNYFLLKRIKKPLF